MTVQHPAPQQSLDPRPRPPEIAGHFSGTSVLALKALLRRVAEWGGLGLGLCGLLLLWAGVFHSLAAEREQVLRGAIQNTSNLARAFEETIVRSVKSIDQSLLYIRDSRLRDPDHFDIAAWTRNIQALTDMTFQISIINRDGILTGSNLALTGNRADLSDREHFRVHRDRAEDQLFISQPILGRVSHRWSIQLTRKILTADGAFDGVIVISLDPQYLSRFYDSVDLGTAGLVLLVGSDGIIRAGARERTGESPTGQSGTADSPTIGLSLVGTTLLNAYAQKPTGQYTAMDVVDGTERLLAYRQVRGLPLLVAVGLATSDVLRSHQRNRVAYISVAATISTIMLAVIALIAVRQSRLTRARRMLRASEAEYAEKSGILETTLEHMSQGIMMVNAEGYVMVCNQHAIDAVGLPPELMTGKPHFDEVVRWQWRHGEFGTDGAGVDERVRTFVLSGGLSKEPHSYQRTRSDGTVLEIRSTPLSGGGLVRTYTDISESKRNEAILRAARDQADAAANAKSEFLATMSHEIRSPMSGLVGVLELLRETNLDPTQARMARMVHASAMSLLEVLNDILDLSKIEAGGMGIILEPTVLRDFVSDIVQPHALHSARKLVSLDVSFDPAVESLAEFDPQRVGQILNNLLSNAVKFTPAGTIRLKVDLVRHEARLMLRITVEDTGIGMNAEVLSRLFNPFTQADGSTSRKYGGTGLGLCISKRIADLLDGCLLVTSSPGEGSCFTLLLPWCPIAPAFVEPVAALDQPGVAELQGRILVADDDPTNRWLAQQQLEMLGFDVDVAEDGAIAFAMLGGRDYDLLLTDCHMPQMDGVALTRAVRASADPILCALPIVGLTADVTAAQKRRCVEAGMTELANKPLPREALAALLSRVLAGVPGNGSRATMGVDTMLPASPGASALAFDPAQYWDLFDPGDADGPAWLRGYLDAGSSICAALTERLSGPLDTPSVRQDISSLAHRLGGSSASVGAAPLGALASVLEDAAEGAALPLLQDQHGAIETEFCRVRQQIEMFVDQTDQHQDGT